jgi:hypothetical protein
MSISLFMISLLVTFGLTTTSTQAEERLPFRATFSGTFVKTKFDTNGDRAPANLNFLEGKVIWASLAFRYWTNRFLRNLRPARTGIQGLPSRW